MSGGWTQRRLASRYGGAAEASEVVVAWALEGAGAAEPDGDHLDLTLVEVASEEYSEEVKEEESSLIMNTG